jgi:hypothetical protein
MLAIEFHNNQLLVSLIQCRRSPGIVFEDLAESPFAPAGFNLFWRLFGAQGSKKRGTSA